MDGATIAETAQKLFGKEGGILTDRAMHVVMASAMISVSGVFLVSPVVSELSGPLSVTDARAGQVVTVYTAPLIVLIPLMGFLADRIGRRAVLLFGLATFGAAGTAVGLVTQLSPVSVRAGSVSSAYVFQRLGQTAGPLAVGFATIGTTYVLVGVLGAALGGAVMAAAYLHGRDADATDE